MHRTCFGALLMHRGNVDVFVAICDAFYWITADNRKHICVLYFDKNFMGFTRLVHVGNKTGNILGNGDRLVLVIYKIKAWLYNQIKREPLWEIGFRSILPPYERTLIVDLVGIITQ